MPYTYPGHVPNALGNSYSYFFEFVVDSKMEVSWLKVLHPEYGNEEPWKRAL